MRKNDNRQAAQWAALLVLGCAVWLAGHVGNSGNRPQVRPALTLPSLEELATTATLAPFLDAPLDINTASVGLLAAVPGIGPKLAERILAHRRRHGPFRSMAELRAVAGIGEQKLAALCRRFTVPVQERGRGVPAAPLMNAPPRNGASPP